MNRRKLRVIENGRRKKTMTTSQISDESRTGSKQKTALCKSKVNRTDLASYSGKNGHLQVNRQPDRVVNSNGSQGGGGEEEKVRRKLILHFDIRNTILVADSVTKVKVEQALNTFLTGVTWGQDVGKEWVWLSDTPSLGPPCPGAITYYKRLERELARRPGDRAHLRQATGDFTQIPLGNKFRPYFDKHLELLVWNHDCHDGLLTMSGTDGRRYHYLLPSFIHLIYNLQAEGRDFAIILRTYGMDASNVLSCLKHVMAGNHPEFQQSLPIVVNNEPGWIWRRDNGKIQCELFEEGSGKVKEKVARIYDDEFWIYEMFNACHGINAFCDDFNHWQQNNYSHLAGKPFWIDLKDDLFQHIFFDDNIRVLADDSIVDVRLLKGDKKFMSIGLTEMVSFENACLVQSDLLQSISNIEYFVEKVKTCEQNYAELVRQLN